MDDPERERLYKEMDQFIRRDFYKQLEKNLFEIVTIHYPKWKREDEVEGPLDRAVMGAALPVAISINRLMIYWTYRRLIWHRLWKFMKMTRHRGNSPSRAFIRWILVRGHIKFMDLSPSEREVMARRIDRIMFNW